MHFFNYNNKYIIGYTRIMGSINLNLNNCAITK